MPPSVPVTATDRGQLDCEMPVVTLHGPFHHCPLSLVPCRTSSSCPASFPSLMMNNSRLSTCKPPAFLCPVSGLRPLATDPSPAHLRLKEAQTPCGQCSHPSHHQWASIITAPMTGRQDLSECAGGEVLFHCFTAFPSPAPSAPPTTVLVPYI